MADDTTKGAADQVDVLAENTKLTARVVELEGQLSEASSKIEEFTKTSADLKAENDKLKAELDTFKAKDMDANKRAADIVARIGITGAKVEAKQEPAKPKTFTERCIEANKAKVATTA